MAEKNTSDDVSIKVMNQHNVENFRHGKGNMSATFPAGSKDAEGHKNTINATIPCPTESDTEKAVKTLKESGVTMQSTNLNSYVDQCAANYTAAHKKPGGKQH